MSETFTSKLGSHRGGRRVWLEGARLVAAGFEAKQTHFQKCWYTASRTLVLTACDPDADGACRVSGKDAKPVIDITGKRVAEFFGEDCEQVRVTYALFKITIERA